MAYSFLINPFAKFFSNIETQNETMVKEQTIANSITISEDDLVAKQQNRISYDGDYYKSFISFDSVFATKKEKILSLRTMADYAYVSTALDFVVNDAIVEDSEGKVVHLEIQDEEQIPTKIAKEIRLVSDYIVDNIFKIKERGAIVFRKFLIEGEVYIEKILRDDGKTLIGIKFITPYLITPLYDSNIIMGYRHITFDKKEAWNEKEVTLPPKEVSYIHWNDYVDGDILNPKSYIYTALRPYNILKNIEDALVAYRMTRAIEKRVFNVEVGTMPPAKAREMMQKMINNYRKTISLDPASGRTIQIKNTQGFNEDFWFEKRNGQGTDVENLESGMNLGELNDVNYFVKTLFMALKIPRSLWDDTAKTMFSSGRSGEIAREEINFAKFVNSVQNEFKKIFVDLLITELRLRGFDEQFIDPSLYNYQFSKNNYYEEYSELALLEEKIQVLNSLFSLVDNGENHGLFAKSFVLKHYFKMTEEEYLENKEAMEQEQLEREEAQLEEYEKKQELIGKYPNQFPENHPTNFQ